MMLNGLYVLAVAATIIGAVVLIPSAIRYDLVLDAMQDLDDEELAAFLTEFPDVLDRRWWK